MPPPPAPPGPGGGRHDGFRLEADAVVTVDGAGRVHQPGLVDVAGGRLVFVGAPDGAPAPPGPVVRTGGVLMPGLVNTHAHSPMTLLRSTGDGLPLDRWLREAVWPLEAAMTDEDVYWGMLLGADEMLTNGVTTTCEHYLHGQAVVDAVLAAGIRAVVTPGVFDLPGAGPAGSWRHFLEEAGELHDAHTGRHSTLTLGFGPHALYSVPDEGLRAVARAAQDAGALVQTHLAETAAEGAEVRRRFGCDAPEALARLGLTDGPVLAAHAVWVTDADLALLASHDVAVAHCPQSNGKLGSGVARVPDMRRRGIRVGLATDGPASNDDLDLWEEMRLAPLLARAVAADAGALATGEALRMATRGGAEALGLDTGALEVGRPADVVRLRADDGRLTPALDGDQLVAHLVWSASSRLVTDVWVAGRHVVSDGRCTTVDGATARREVHRRARRVAAAAGA